VRSVADGSDADTVGGNTVGGGNAAGKQLCQGHCPVQHVASQFPQLCEAETQAFSQLLGVHVQRLATLAHGEHVCTTNIPLAPMTKNVARQPVQREVTTTSREEKISR
jgi:predicted ArsR family transcriptional regulator